MLVMLSNVNLSLGMSIVTLSESLEDDSGGPLLLGQLEVLGVEELSAE